MYFKVSKLCSHTILTQTSNIVYRKLNIIGRSVSIDSAKFVNLLYILFIDQKGYKRKAGRLNLEGTIAKVQKLILLISFLFTNENFPFTDPKMLASRSGETMELIAIVVLVAHYCASCLSGSAAI